MAHLWLIYLLKIVIFHSYVSLLEGNYNECHQCKPNSHSRWIQPTSQRFMIVSDVASVEGYVKSYLKYSTPAISRLHLHFIPSLLYYFCCLNSRSNPHDTPSLSIKFYQIPLNPNCHQRECVLVTLGYTDHACMYI